MQFIPTEIENTLVKEYSISVQRFKAAHGGCINNGGELITNQGNFFIKWNDSFRYPEMFKKEAKGLQLLSKASSVRVPDVLYVSEVGHFQFILLELITSAPRKKNYWDLLGKHVALLHQHSSEMFGLDHDNYIGSLSQYNSQNTSWVDFFIHQRLEIQLSLAERHHRINTALRKRFELLYKKLSNLFPDEKPALLHGDLWSGNVLINSSGEPALIDPAVYYGNREAELAYTQLFGGFDQQFYHAYQDVFPLETGFDERSDVYNLYPLMVHVNLFGGAYRQQVERILSRYA